MTRPRYIAKRIGDRYETIRVDPGADVARLGWVIGGGIVGSYGLLRGGLGGLLLGTLGAGMLYQGVTGVCPWGSLGLGRRRSGSRKAPSYAHEGHQRAPQLPEDKVDEAAMESFPASDPPNYSSSG